MPKISIIVPIYNIIDCLERCVRSIINQTYKDLEIILVDDGSTDGTEKLVDELAKRDNRIKAVHKENGGLADARNVGVSESTGEYISFVDSDDFIELSMFDNIVATIKTSKMKQIMDNYKKINNKENSIERDKFAKLEAGGKKSKKAMEQRNLEKAAKPKKHSKYKQQVEEEEEEDILEGMPTGTIALTVPITVGGFCEQAEISLNTVIGSFTEATISSILYEILKYSSKLREDNQNHN